MTEALKKPVRTAQRRLWLNRWLTALGWSLTGAAVVVLGAVLVDRLWLAPENLLRFYGVVAGLSATFALLGSLTWSLITRESARTAAAQLDLAAGLKERISTSLYCQSIADPFAQAVVADATRTIRGLDVRRHLPLVFPRSAGYAGGTMFLALLCFLVFPAVDLSGKQQVREEQQKKATQAQKAQTLVKPVVDQQMRKLEKNPLIKKEMEDLEPMKEARVQTPLDMRQDAFKKIEKLSEKLENKRNSNELSQVDAFKQMLRRLAEQQQKGDNPVNSLSKALSKGDFKSAQDALNQIQKELAKPTTRPEDSQRAEEMKAQLQQLSQKLNQLAQEDKKTKEELAKNGLSQEDIKKAMENLKKGDMQKLQQQLADKGLSQQQVQQMMQQMKKNAAACSACNNLGQKLAQAAGAAGAGQLSQDAQQGLTAAGEQLSKMEAMQQELGQLSASLSDLKAAKDALGNNCPMCNGTGMCNGQACSMCQGTGMGVGGNPDARGSGMGNLGQGEGGAAPEQATDFKTVTKRTPVNTLPGRIISQQFIDGEQFKGEVSKDYVEAALAADRQVQDAIAREAIPRSIQGSVSKYFNHTFGDVAKPGGTTATKPAQ